MTRTLVSKHLSALAAMPLLAGALVAGQPSARAETAPSVAAVARPQLADVIEAAQPAVVMIEASRPAGRMERLNGATPERGMVPFGPFPFRQAPFGMVPFPERDGVPRPEGRIEGMGSGFVIDGDGYVVTNNHVIEGADEVRVTFADGESVAATVIGTDPQTDLALLKVETDRELPAVAFGDSETARVGDWVVAIGSPFGLGGSVTAGIISAVGRDIRSGPYDNYIQIDAPINRGNSGGPIIGADGRVVGVNTAIFSPNGGNIGIGFAIPARDAAHIVGELREHGSVTRGWLGVHVQSVDEDVAAALGLGDARGALVADVAENSPAALAGLAAGDLIVRFGDTEVTEPRDLSRAVARTEPGAKVHVAIVRDGRAERFTAIVDRSATSQVAARAPSGEPDREGFGLALAPLDGEARSRLGLDEDVNGALVVRVRPGSGAAAGGLRPGDVIVRVNRRVVARLDAAISALEAARRDAGKAVVLVRRGPSQFFAALDVA